jgi:F-type H+-transporting ATPase subunit delta
MSGQITTRMRGASAASLDDTLAAVAAADGSATELGGQLFGVVGALDGSPRLRRVLTDPATSSESTDGLVTSIFGNAVSAATLGVVKKAAAGRWSAGRDLSDALELAGVVAHVRAADEAGTLDTLETQLFEVEQLITGDLDLRRTLSDTTIPVAARSELLTTILGGKVDDTTLALVVQAVAARTGSFERTLTTFATTVADRRGRLLAEVRVASELGDAESQRLAAALAAKYGREVHLNVVVDPAVIGGISVSVADDVVDGTMSSRLEAARRRLAG